MMMTAAKEPHEPPLSTHGIQTLPNDCTKPFSHIEHRGPSKCDPHGAANTLELDVIVLILISCGSIILFRISESASAGNNDVGFTSTGAPPGQFKIVMQR